VGIGFYPVGRALLKIVQRYLAVYNAHRPKAISVQTSKPVAKSVNDGCFLPRISA
jgi:hypothetical protein